MEALIAQRLPLFWKMMAVVTAAVALLLWRYLTLLGRGCLPGQEGTPAGVRGLLGAVLRRPSAGRRRFLSHLLLDGLLHRRLWHRDRARWLAHQAMLSGFLGLAFLSFLAALSEHALLPLGLTHPVVAALRDKDQPFLAALHETLGLVLLLGGLAAGLRRGLRRPTHLPNEGADVAAISLLLFIVASGYPLESLRLLAESVPPSVARYSYLGWLLARWMAPLDLAWPIWHFWVFQAHVIASVALFVYWPMSKMVHVLLSPFIAALGASEAQPTR